MSIGKFRTLRINGENKDGVLLIKGTPSLKISNKMFEFVNNYLYIILNLA